MKLIEKLIIIVMVLIVSGLTFLGYNRNQTHSFYQAINNTYWGRTSAYGKLVPNVAIVTYYDIVFSVDSFRVYFNQDSGKIVLINTNTDDTIFKYIKEQE